MITSFLTREDVINTLNMPGKNLIKHLILNLYSNNTCVSSLIPHSIILLIKDSSLTEKFYNKYPWEMMEIKSL